jgi:tetratricopeptide (TPR) repeat protein
MKVIMIFAVSAIALFSQNVTFGQGCPLVTVVPSVKSVSKISRPLTFTAKLTRTAAGAAYNWQVTGAAIASGQGTATITIDSTLLAADTGTVKAAVDVQAAGCSSTSSSAEVSITPPTARDYYDRGMKGVLLGDRKAAIADLTKAIEMDPKMAAAYDGRATGRLIEEDYDGAIADNTKVIELDPRNARAYHARGVAKLYKKDYAGAAEDFSKTIELDPKHMLAYEKRSEAKEGLGDLDGAIADVTKAMELKPDDIGLYGDRARYYKKAGKTDLAAADIAKVDELVKRLEKK